jgi:HK97 family phage major capsid protein
MTTETLVQKNVDLALSQLTANGGLLLPEQNATFIRRLIDAPTMLRAVRTVPMDAPEMRLNKIGFGQRILRAAAQGTSPYQLDSGANNRNLAAADRVRPQTSQVTLNTKEVMAEVRIPYEVLEDNIEKGNLTDTILTLIAERAALDLEELLILGDTASTDNFLKLHNGVLKLLTTNVVNWNNAAVSIHAFNTLKKALPTRYRRNLGAMRFFSSMDRESDYRVTVAARQTGLGDNALTTNTAPLPVLGVPLLGAALMPNAQMVFTDPQNVILGIQRNIRIEQDRDIRSREIVIVLTARIAIQIEEEDAAAKLINLGG